MTSITVRKSAGLRRRPAWMTLGVLAWLLTIPNGHTAAWHTSIISGQGVPNSRTIPWGVVPVGGNTFLVYAIATNSGTIFQGSNSGTCASPDWHFAPIYSSDSATRALQASATVVNTFDIAHVDSDRKVRLSVWSSLFGTTLVVDGEGQNTFNNLADVSTANFNGQLHIFYREWNQPYVGNNILHQAIYDGASFSYQTVDDTGNFAESTAVQAADGLHVYYYDEDDGTLREAISADGVHFASHRILDTGGGHHPSAILFNGTINVFYEDAVNGWLRLAQIVPFTADTTIGWVAPMDSGSYNTPLIHKTAMQVYFTGGGQLRAAWGTVPNGFGWLPLDGPGVNAPGASQDVMYTTVAALEVNNTAPSVFYEDSVTGALRNACWVP